MNNKPSFLEFNGVTLSTTKGSPKDLVDLVLYVQGMRKEPPPQMDVWLRQDRNPFFKGQSDQAAEYLRGLMSTPHFVHKGKKLLVVVNGQEHNPVRDLASTLQAVMVALDINPRSRAWIMQQIEAQFAPTKAPTNGHKPEEAAIEPASEAEP